MEVGSLKIDNPLASRIFHIGVPDLPFVRHRPIEHLRSGSHFVNGQWNMPADDLQRSANALARNAAADRKKLGHQPIHFRPRLLLLGGFHNLIQWKQDDLLRREIRISSIAVCSDSDAAGPLDAERGVIPANSARVLGRVELRHLVENFRLVLER